jgi:hypothetical protein
MMIFFLGFLQDWRDLIPEIGLRLGVLCPEILHLQDENGTKKLKLQFDKNTQHVMVWTFY